MSEITHESPDRQLLALEVNGEQYEVLVEPRRTLVDVLRHDLGLTGTHVGCEHGICGACTVLVDGAPARSCLLFATQAEGYAIRTVESLGQGDGQGVGVGQGVGQGDGSGPQRRRLGDLQEAFTRHHALQCGFCTPGFLMLAEGYLAERPAATKEEIREVVAANLCRCTGYQTIVEAIDDCAARRRAAESEEVPCN